MFQTRSEVQLLIMLSIWAVILFTACERNERNDSTPTSAPAPTTSNGTLSDGSPTPDNDPTTQTPVPSPGVVATETLPPPRDNFANTAAVFLLDVSTSIQDLCEPQFQEWRADIPQFFVTYAHAYHHNERGRNEEFKIGWATFPTPPGESLNLSLEGLNAFANYPEWNGKLENDLATYRDGLGFSDALDNVVKKLSGNEYNEYQKIIFLISDAYLNYRNSSPEVTDEQGRISQSLKNIPEDWHLYIIQLPCNKADEEYPLDSLNRDIDYWHQTVQDINHVHLLHRNELSTLKSVADALFKNNNDTALQSLLPWEPQAGRYGWGWIDGQNITLENGDPPTWQTDGDTIDLNITAVAIDTNGFQLFADSKTVGNRVYPAPNSNTSLLYTYYYNPQQIADGNCEIYEWGFQPQNSSDNTVGIFWWQASYPELELTVTVDPPTVMNNPHSFSVNATLHDGDDSCYQGQLKINGQIYLNAQGRPELRDIINLSWYDIPYDPSKIPLQFPVIVEILRRNSIIISQRSNILMLSTTLVDINFTPVMHSSSIDLECPTCSISNPITKTVVSLTLDYASHHHYRVSAPLNPEIYLLTEKTRHRQIAIGCNQAKLGDVVPVLDNNDYVLQNNTPTLYAYRLDIGNGNVWVETGLGPQFKTTITAKIPKSWQTYCAYTGLLLQWPDELNQDNWPTILCPLEPGEACEEQNNRVIHH